MQVYVGNADDGDFLFSYWSATTNETKTIRLGPRAQVLLPDISQQDLDNMIGQYMNFGFAQASSPHFGGTGLCYEIDNPIPDLAIS